MITQTVSRSLAELAREAGFKEDTLFGLTPYGNMTSKLSIPTDGTMPYVKWKKHDSDLRLPTYFELSKWLRSSNKFHIHVSYDFYRRKYDYAIQNLSEHYTSKRRTIRFDREFDSYEEALEAGLKYCLSWIK